MATSMGKRRNGDRNRSDALLVLIKKEGGGPPRLSELDEGGAQSRKKKG